MDTPASDRPPVAERLNVALIPEASTALAELQARSGLKKVDLVNRAIAIYEFIDAETRAGNQLLVQRPDGTTQLVKIFF